VLKDVYAEGIGKTRPVITAGDYVLVILVEPVLQNRQQMISKVAGRADMRANVCSPDLRDEDQANKRFYS